MAELRVAAVTDGDLRAVAELHLRAFADSAITVFGTEAVRRYYAWLLNGPHDARLMGAWRDGVLVGFCAAGVFRGAMNGFLRNNRRYLAFRVMTHPSLLASRLVRDRIVTALSITMKYARVRRRVETIAPSFGVLAIATDARVRGSGAGRALMTEAENRARSSGFDRMVLTVHPTNSNAVRFYERLGWTRAGESLPWTGTMEKTLS